MSVNQNVYQVICKELIRAFQPLVKAVETAPDGLIQLLLEIGYELETTKLNAVINYLRSLPGNFHDLEAIVNNPEALPKIMNGIRSLIGDTKNLDTIQEGMGQRLFEYLLILHIEEHYGPICGILLLIGI